MSNRQLHENNASTLLTLAVGIADSVIVVDNGDLFPTPTGGEYFLATIDDGTNVEIIRVNGRSGDSFTDVVRGQEGTQPHEFVRGVSIENRLTRDTIGDFARLEDRFGDINSVGNAPRPSDVISNSFLTQSLDDGGQPIILVKTDGLWKSLAHPEKIATVTTSADGTATTARLIAAASLIPEVVAGKYLLEFTNGPNAGLPRLITNVTGDQITWLEALPNTTVTGHAFEVYISTFARIESIKNGTGDVTLNFDPTTLFNSMLDTEGLDFDLVNYFDQQLANPTPSFDMVEYFDEKLDD